MTKFFVQLGRAERDIKGHFMTFRPRKSGNYTKRELSHFDAYTVLVHAEIETYFESCANRAIDIAEAFLKQDTYNRILYSLGAFYARLPDDGESLLKVPAERYLERERWRRSISLHRDVVKGNNGIKIDNLCRMLIPIGLDVRNIDGVLLVELDQFGAIRGSMAHSGTVESSVEVLW